MTSHVERRNLPLREDTGGVWTEKAKRGAAIGAIVTNALAITLYSAGRVGLASSEMVESFFARHRRRRSR